MKAKIGFKWYLRLDSYVSDRNQLLLTHLLPQATIENGIASMPLLLLVHAMALVVKEVSPNPNPELATSLVSDGIFTQAVIDSAVNLLKEKMLPQIEEYVKTYDRKTTGLWASSVQLPADVRKAVQGVKSRSEESTAATTTQDYPYEPSWPDDGAQPPSPSSPYTNSAPSRFRARLVEATPTRAPLIRFPAVPPYTPEAPENSFSECR